MLLVSKAASFAHYRETNQYVVRPRARIPVYKVSDSDDSKHTASASGEFLCAANTSYDIESTQDLEKRDHSASGTGAGYEPATGGKRHHCEIDPQSRYGPGEPTFKTRRTSAVSQCSDSASAVRDVWIYQIDSDDKVRGRAVLDTGACANFISKRMASKIHVRRHGYSGGPISTANRYLVQVEDKMTIEWSIVKKANVYQDDFLIAEDLGPDIIIGLPTLAENGFFNWNSNLCVLGFKPQSAGT